MSLLQRTAPPLVLATASTARQAVLRGAGLAFTAEAAAVDEAAIKESAQAEGIPVEDAAMLLAEAKAQRIARRHPEALVIGADQMLVCDGRWFDKPVGMDGARAHLRALRGRTHELVSALVCWRQGQRVWQHLARPRLTMRDFSDDFLEAYLAAEGEALLSSVGAYRLEGPGVQLFSRVEGEHAAILGLPLLPLLDFLRQHGVLLR
ncbi:Maf family protein [Paracraurococcus ruber]|uniref:Nucleoside triphosphate pyrophosphatase n=1 Tax=Paracraurococcus ruber TaxID=77675 RepID=A0ABS1CQW8_9PROT|nr:Maf family protein [Paracraurococcus ruber]MBK1656763.1 septum formation protein Maf [Paracraurococcus ruber]TDG33626.1 septum formation protein Maf [Paracraurococcus ruber]